MMARPTTIYATKDDITDWLTVPVSECGLAFTLAGSFSTPNVSTYVQLDAVPNLGFAMSGDQLREPIFLIHKRDMNVSVREVHQRRGGVRYLIDQRENPACVGVCFGGQYGDAFVISGQLGHGTDAPESKDLHQILLSRLRATFVSIKASRVGRNAATMLDRGARLTINHAADPAYDLAR